MKKVLLLVIILIILVPVKLGASVVAQTSEFYVNDSANLLTEETKNYIIEKSNQLNNIDGTQIVVVTVDNLGGNSIENYALKLFRQYGIGDKEKNNGLLLLLAKTERLFRVEVGYGLEGVLPDGKTGRFQDEYIIPYFKADKWDEGVINGYNAFFEEIVEQKNLSLNYEKPQKTNGLFSNMGLIIVIIGAVLLLIFSPNTFFFIIGSMLSGGRGSRGGGSFGGGGSSGGGGSTRGF